MKISSGYLPRTLKLEILVVSPKTSTATGWA